MAPLFQEIVTTLIDNQEKNQLAYLRTALPFQIDNGSHTAGAFSHWLEVSTHQQPSEVMLLTLRRHLWILAKT